MQTIDHEIAWYKANRQQFIKDYDGKYLVIKDEQIAGIYNSNTEAQDTARSEFLFGTYIIEHPVDIYKVREQGISKNATRK